MSPGPLTGRAEPDRFANRGLDKNSIAAAALVPCEQDGAHWSMTDESASTSEGQSLSRIDGENWTASDLADLAKAVAALERSSFAARLNELLGRQIGFAGELVPERIGKAANAAAAKALGYAMRVSLATLGDERRPASSRLHLAAVAASGALGGAFGLLTLPLELPVSTALILRSVAEIAREEGEDLATPEAGLACIEVFGLGAGRETTQLGESSYFAARALLAKSVSEATRYIVKRGIVEESAPVLVRLFGQIASRFGLVVTQKIMAQTVPVLGAVTGAAINAAFMDHYQSLARAHFIVRRLERRYGADIVRRAFERMRNSSAGGAETKPTPTLAHLARNGLPAVEHPKKLR